MQNKDFILKNKIKIETQNLDIFIATDEKWTIFIINQIINNAMKYMDKKEKIISFSGIKEKNKTILTIKDNGCGIKESDLPRVFEKVLPEVIEKKNILQDLAFIYVKSYV